MSEAAPLRLLVEQGWVWAADLQGLGRQLHQLLSDGVALQAQGQRARLAFEDTLATPAVARHLHHAAHQALADPKPADGRMINALETLDHRISSPLMAYRYQKWSKELIGWLHLEQLGRDPQLVSIVIPVYGNPKNLDACLNAVRSARTSWQWELIAVMNDDCLDLKSVLHGHLQADDRIRVVWPGENTQFALGCNIGFSESRGQWLVLLNNDCEVPDYWLDEVLKYLIDDNNAIACQPRLETKSGKIASYGTVFGDKQVIGVSLYEGEMAVEHRSNQIHILQAICGACLVTRSKIFASAKGFDCAFINGQEDTDFCLRAHMKPESYCISATGIIAHHEGEKAPGRYCHKNWNRKMFKKRWLNKIRRDDIDVYAADGYEIEGYYQDNAISEYHGVASRKPKLAASITSDLVSAAYKSLKERIIGFAPETGNSSILSIAHTSADADGGIQKCIRHEIETCKDLGITYINVFPLQWHNSLDDSLDYGLCIEVFKDSERYSAHIKAHELEDLVRILRAKLIVVHSLCGHPLKCAAKCIVSAQGNYGIPLNYMIHDFGFACQSQHLIAKNQGAKFFCDMPELDSSVCQSCFFGSGRNEHSSYYAPVINAAQAIVAPSYYAQEMYQRYLRQSSTARNPNIKQIQHYEILGPAISANTSASVNLDCEIGVAFYGFPAWHKGWDEYEFIASSLSDRAHLRFYCISKSEKNSNYISSIYFSDSEGDDYAKLLDLASKYNIGIFVFLNQAPETYGFAIHAAAASGRLVLCNTNTGGGTEGMEDFKNIIIFDSIIETLEFLGNKDLLISEIQARHSAPLSLKLRSFNVSTLKPSLSGE